MFSRPIYRDQSFPRDRSPVTCRCAPAHRSRLVITTWQNFIDFRATPKSTGVTTIRTYSGWERCILYNNLLIEKIDEWFKLWCTYFSSTKAYALDLISLLLFIDETSLNWSRLLLSYWSQTYVERNAKRLLDPANRIQIVWSSIRVFDRRCVAYLNPQKTDAVAFPATVNKMHVHTIHTDVTRKRNSLFPFV